MNNLFKSMRDNYYKDKMNREYFKYHTFSFSRDFVDYFKKNNIKDILKLKDKYDFIINRYEIIDKFNNNIPLGLIVGDLYNYYHDYNVFIKRTDYMRFRSWSYNKIDNDRVIEIYKDVIKDIFHYNDEEFNNIKKLLYKDNIDRDKLLEVGKIVKFIFDLEVCFDKDDLFNHIGTVKDKVYKARDESNEKDDRYSILYKRIKSLDDESKLLYLNLLKKTKNMSDKDKIEDIYNKLIKYYKVTNRCEIANSITGNLYEGNEIGNILVSSIDNDKKLYYISKENLINYDSFYGFMYNKVDYTNIISSSVNFSCGDMFIDNEVPLKDLDRYVSYINIKDEMKPKYLFVLISGTDMFDDERLIKEAKVVGEENNIRMVVVNKSDHERRRFERDLDNALRKW